MSLRPPSGAFPPPAQVKSLTTSTPDSFTLGSDGQGEIIAAWYGFNTSSMTNVVSASVKPEASPTFGAPQIISDPTVFSGPPVMSFDQSGDAVAAFPLGPGNDAGISTAFYDDTPPTVGAISGPSTGTTGAPVTFSIPQPTDAFTASPSIVWNFGDGSADGHRDAGVSHVRRSRWLHRQPDRHR